MSLLFMRWVLTTTGSGPRDSALLACYATGAGPLLRTVSAMNLLSCKTNRRPWRLLSVVMVLAIGLLCGCATKTRYFPPGAESWYAAYLEAMGEPSLYQQRSSKTTEQYRFVCLSTGLKPVAVRAQRNESATTMRVVRLSGASGYEPGHVEYDRTFNIQADKWEELLARISRAQFWSTPTKENYSSGYDGSRWVLEGQGHGKYHVVDRWTPELEVDERRLAEFVACCEAFSRLSNLEAKQK